MDLGWLKSTPNGLGLAQTGSRKDLGRLKSASGGVGWLQMASEISWEALGVVGLARAVLRVH